MYITQLDIFGSQRYPLALGTIYNQIAESYELPSIETLLKSMNNDVVWPDRTRSKLQVYYLEDMIETQPERAHFQVRFTTSRDARAHASLFLSIEQSQVRNISLQFPGRSGKMASSKVLGFMKSTVNTLHMGARDLEFEVQGWAEAGKTTYIKEHSLSAFNWIDGLNRYLHVREDPRDIDDIRRGFSKL